MAQSNKAVKLEGVITVIGFISGEDDGTQPKMLEALLSQSIVRGILVGNRLLFEEMNQAIEANDIHPVIDEKEFTLDQVKEAYQYMWDQK
jgi:D-arabinose 1-dehydrogenase-like Zn-dependent alcohol dehydrogenase